MDFSILISPSLGILVGILMGLTGAGGGILSVPLLVFALHLPVAETAPISLSAIALAAGVGALLGFKNNILRYKAAGLMAIFGLLFSPIGLWLAGKIPNGPLLIIFSTILVYVSIDSIGRLIKQSMALQILITNRLHPACWISLLANWPGTFPALER